jgi:hypothetical protein
MESVKLPEAQDGTMSEAFTPALNALQIQLAKHEKAVSETKMLINRLSEAAGLPIPYAETDSASSVSIASIRSDTFYGKKLATAMREYLEMRRAANLGPAETREIYDAVTKGGFQFDAANATNAMTGMRQLMTKNSNQFHKLPNGAWGLTSWYENIKTAKQKPQEDRSETTEAAEDETSTASK